MRLIQFTVGNLTLIVGGRVTLLDPRMTSGSQASDLVGWRVHLLRMRSMRGETCFWEKLRMD